MIGEPDTTPVTPAVADVLARAKAGELLGPSDVAAIFHLGRSQFCKLNREGKWEQFKVRPAIGARCYSGVLITRYLAGEPLYLPTFDKRQRRA